MATDIKVLGDQIVGLTLLEAKQLADYLKETHGIEAAAGGAVVMAAAAADAAEVRTALPLGRIGVACSCNLTLSTRSSVNGLTHVMRFGKP